MRWSDDAAGRPTQARPRRRAGLVRLGAVVLPAVVLVVAVVVTSVEAVVGRSASAPAPDHALAPIDGYPQRIGFRRPSPALPDRPGALAATLVDNNYGNPRHLGVTSRGRLWELPLGVRALSPDGTVLLSGRSFSQWSSAVSAHDLATGQRRTFDDVGRQNYERSQRRRFRYLVEPSKQVHWSQDSSAVLIMVAERPRWNRVRPMVLNVSAGDITKLAGTHSAGFRSPTEAVTLSTRGRGADADEVIAITTDLGTGETGDVPLRVRRPVQRTPGIGLRASVSPDGSTLLLVEVARGARPTATLRAFSLEDGTELPSRVVDDWATWDDCAIAWLNNDPVVPTRTHVAGSTLVTRDGSRPLVAVHHRLQSFCLEVTTGALAEGPHRSFLGTRTAAWTWYWRPLVALTALALAAAFGARAWQRVKRRPFSADAAAPDYRP